MLKFLLILQPEKSIPNVCRIMVDDSLGSTMYRVAEVNRVMGGNNCTDADYRSLVDTLKVTDWSNSCKKIIFFYDLKLNTTRFQLKLLKEKIYMNF
jgi:hypothetical protein